MRNLGLIISFWLAAIAMPTNSLALGLGEIEVNSFLNQPLNAEIEVISARAGEIDDLLVGLASRDAFSRAGLTRASGLSDLRFAVKKNEEGDSAVILVTTKASVKEPFLNFLVEADWAKGRLLREFTVLLDPPFYADTPAPAPTPVAETQQLIPEPVVEPVETEIAVEVETTNDQPVIPEPIALTESEASVETEVFTQQAEEPVAETEYADEPVAQEVFSGQESITSPGDVTVVKDDTLWSIASNIQASGQSVNQIMLAIQRANPGAFNDNNINNLKIGSVLRMPEASEIAEISQQQAYAQALEQNGLWDDYVARVTGQTSVAVESDGGSQGDGQTAESGAELNLITPGDGQSDAASLQGEGEDANELRVKLALAEEELDGSRVENRELESQIAELEARLSKFEELQKMVEIEDDSLAQLQAQQAEDELAEEELVSNEAIDAAQKAADEDELLEELLLVEEADTDTMTDDSDELVDDSAQQDQLSETPPVPVIVTQPVSDSPSLLDGILPPAILDMIPDMGGILPSMDNLALDPVMLGGLGGILLLLIGLVVYKRKNKSGDSEEEFTVNDPIYVAEEDDLTPIHLAEGAFEGLDDLDDSDISLPDDLGITEALDEGFDDIARTEVVPSIQAPEPESSAASADGDEQDDILNEADVYLAYNLYDNAEELLTQSLESNPERADYRSKLLDTHFATKNTDAFVSEAETLKSMGNAANRYWDRVLIMGYELAPDNALFAAAKDSGMSAADLEISKPASADFELGVGAEEDNTNFSTTDFDLGEEDTNTFQSTEFLSGESDSDELEIPDLDELPDLDTEDRTDIRASLEDDVDMPDDIGDLDFSLDSDEDQKPEPEDVDFELPEELDLGGDGVYEANIESTAVIEAGTAVIDTDAFVAQIDDEDDGYGTEATAIIEIGDDDDLSSYGMEDTAFVEPESDDALGVELDLSDFEDDEELAMDIEMDVDNSKTDTFAPGDFDDPEELLADEADLEGLGIDGIEDLMLPDDVDEVSTKLDLARAFIDMGDSEGARSSLDEVVSEGNDEQKAEATSLLKHL